MANLMKRVALATLLSTAAFQAGAIGWPSQYEGVMLQGFYWDSYTDTKWTNLESQAGMIHFGYPRCAVTFVDNPSHGIYIRVTGSRAVKVRL